MRPAASRTRKGSQIYGARPTSSLGLLAVIGMCGGFERTSRRTPLATYAMLGEDAAERCVRPGSRLRACSEPDARNDVESVHDLFRVVLHGRGQEAGTVPCSRVRGRPQTFAAVRSNTRHRKRREHPSAGFAVRVRSPPSGERRRWGTRWGTGARKAISNLSEMASELRKRGGRYWDRTSDLFRVSLENGVHCGSIQCVGAGQRGERSRTDDGGLG